MSDAKVKQPEAVELSKPSFTEMKGTISNRDLPYLRKLKKKDKDKLTKLMKKRKEKK